MKNLLFFALAGMIAFTSCNQPKPVKTIADLKDGITGETTASAKYAAFSQKAIEEGYDTIAKFFDAASKAEAIHAENHTKALEEMGEKMDAFTPEFEVKTTAENLREAINGETYEIQKMYPQFLADAKEEKAEKAEKSFSWAFDTEKKHLQFYQKAIEALEGGNESKLSFSYAVCPVCGNTYDANNVDEKCAFCQTGKDKFIFN